ncbi:MAG: hypothetical protein ABI036_15295 [Fibrobacteria bacterium]
MKKLSVLMGLVLAAWAGATVCQQTYHLQEAYQVILTGHTPSTLEQQGARTLLNKSMSNAAVISDGTEYRILTDWDATGTCDTYVKKEIKFAHRKKGDAQFSVEVTNNYALKINDGEYGYKKPGWDEYWFGIADSVNGSTVTLYDAIGKSKSKTQFHVWYGNVVLKQTLRSQTGADTGTSTYSYPVLTSHPDSAVLRAVLVDSLKTAVQSEPKDLAYTFQLIYAAYDSVPSPVAIGGRGVKAQVNANGFQATQTGNVVLIRPGEKSANASEPLSLYGMMGNRIAALHPTGYLYQWNGKTFSGADAPTGVYFVQSGNRILGKFFYTR